MNAKIWGRWLKRLFKQAPTRAKRRVRPQSRLSCEHLEDRLTPTTYTWTGLGSSPNWSVAANWSSSNGGSAAPSTAAGAIDDLVFGALTSGAGVARPTNNNFANLIVNSITFAANPTSGSTYTLGGNGITLVGGINVGANLGTETIALNMTLTPPTATLQQTFTIPSASTLDISGTLSESEPATGGNSAATETAEETLTKAGAGTLQLDGSNANYTGAISIANTGGILVVTNSNALGLGQSVSGVPTAGTTTISSGTQLQIQGGATALKIPEQLIINGTGIINDGALLNTTGNNTWTGPITMDSNSTFGANANTTLSISGQITDVGAGESLTKTGPGTVVFNHVGGNTYRGTTTINNGILEIEDPLSLGAGANSGTTQSGTPQAETIVNYNPITGIAGTLELGFTGTLGANDPNGILTNPNAAFNSKTNPYIGFQVFNDILVLNGPGFGGIGALFNLNGDNAWDGNVALGSPSSVPNTGNVSIGVAPTSVATPNTNLTISGVVSSVSPLPTPLANLIKVGGGALILNDANTFVGNVYIEQGAINVGDSNALGSPTTNNVFVGYTPTLAPTGLPAALQLQVDSGLDGTMANGVLEQTHFRNLGFDSVNGSGPGQELDISGTTGTFTLSLTTYTSTGFASTFTSSAVNVSSPTFITDLTNAVTNLLNSAGFPATGNVTVTEDVAGSGTGNLYRIIFSGTLATVNIPLMTASQSSIVVNPNGVLVGKEQLGITGTTGSFTLNLTKSGTTFVSSAVGLSSPTFIGDLTTAVTNLLNNAGYSATGNVTVTETPGSTNLYTIAFSGSLANITIPVMTPTLSAIAVNPIYGLTIANPLSMIGTGVGTSPDGALDSISGLNTYTGPISLGSVASIGVDADTRVGHFLADSNYLADDYSLTINGNGKTSGIVSGSGTFDKFGLGDLILPTANNYISANDVEAGWVTVENNQSLGVQQNLTQTLQSYTTVQIGAAVMLDPQTSFLALANNFALSGNGITPTTKAPAIPNVYGLIDQGGAIENLNGNNLLTGIIQLNGNAGLGVEQVFAQTPGSTPTSQLTVTGTLEDGSSPGGITKLGSRRLIIEGPGTYTGNVDIADGVLLLQNSTGLGVGNVASPPTVTVETGAALEIGNTTTALSVNNSLGGATFTSSLSGGIQEGLEVWGEHLILNGSGDPTFGDTALTVLSSNAPVVGPTVQTVAVSPSGSFALTYGGQTTTTLSATASAATVQAALDSLTSISGFTGAFATVSQNGNVYLITITNPTNPGQAVTTAPLAPTLPATGNGAAVAVGTTQLSTTTETLAPVNDPVVSIDNIWQGPVSLNSNTTITVPANSRLIMGGSIGNGANSPTSGYGGSSLTLVGGGELDLDGNNNYSGTTFVDQGVLTAGSSGALGTTGVPEIQSVKLTGATANSTKFILTFTSLSGIVTPTAAITYTGVAVTDQAAIQKALNALTTIGGGADVGGSVTVSESIAAGTVTITVTFGGTLSGFPQNLLNASILSGSGTIAVSPLTPQTTGGGGTVVANGASLQLAGSVTIAGEPLIIQGNGSLQDVQTIAVTATSGTFNLSFTGPDATGNVVTDTTATPLNVGSGTLAMEIQNALMGLGNIGGVDGTVSVAADATQTLTFVPGATGTFTLSFTAPDSTGTTVTDTTTALNLSSLTLAGDIQIALDNFSNIGGVGGNVTVTETSAGVFAIAFGGTFSGHAVPTMTADNSLVIGGTVGVAPTGTTYVATFGGALAGKPLQTMTVTNVTPLNNGGKVTSLTTQVGDSAAQTIPTQWFEVGPTTVSGGQTAGNQAVAGSVTAIAVDPDDPNTIYIATAGGGVWKTINGGANWYPIFDSIPEIQTITVNTGGSFTLGFGGDTTTILNGNDTNLALDMQSALDALGSIGGAGGLVTVFQSASILDIQTVTVTAKGGTFTLSFTGANSTGTVVTDTTTTLNVASTTLASDIQNALQALGNIGGIGGTVNVVKTGTTFAVTFGGTLSGQGLQTMKVNEISLFTGGTVTVATTQVGQSSYQVTFGGQLAGLSESLISTNILNGSIGITELEAGANPLFAMYVGAIAINPNNPNVIYVGTGVTNNSSDSFYGTGIYESTNAGVTWAQMTNNTTTNPSVVANPFYGRGISSMVVDPRTNDLIVADGDSTQGQDEVQTLVFFGSPFAFTLSLTAANSNGVLVTDTTSAIAGGTLGFIASQIQTDLDAFSNIGGVGGYVVAAPIGFGGISITFEGYLSLTTLPALVTNWPLPNSPPPPAIGVEVSAVSGPTTVVNGTTGGPGSGPGIWRFTPNPSFSTSPTGGKWVNLTDVTSTVRAGTPSGNSNDTIYDGTIPSEPDTPGPDDDYQIFFPQTNATWSDVSLATSSTGQQILFAALGSSSIGTTNTPQGTPEDAVYWTTNFSGNLANVTWYIGNPWVSGVLTPDAESKTIFPSPAYNGFNSGKPPENGNIKISAVTGGTYSNEPGLELGYTGPGSNDGFATIYASVATAGGSLANIYVSTDGGVDWAAVPSLPSSVYMSDEGQYDNSILAVNDTTVYIGGQVASGNIAGQTGQIYMTANSGASWTDISVLAGSGPAEGQHAIVQDDNNGILFGNDGGIWLLNPTNSGWSDANGDLANSEVNSVASDPTNVTGIATNPATITAVAGIQSNGTAGFNEGQTWAELDDSAGGEMSGGQVFIDPTNPNIIYEVQTQPGAAGPAGSGAIVRESNDDGASWNTIFSYPTITSANIALEMDEINPERLVVGGGVLTLQQLNAGVDSGLYVTLNASSGTPTWTNIGVNNNTGAPTLPITVSAIGLAEYQGTFTTDASFPDVTDQGANAYVPNTIYVTNGTQVYLTKDGGQTWVERDAGLPSNIVQLVVDPRNMDTVYAVTNGFGNGGVWVSFNAGQKWTQIGTNNGLPNVPVWSFVIDPRNNNLYVGTDTGVYELVDGGVNGAGTWQVFGTGMPNVQVHDLVLNPTTNTLLAATYGRGVFELILDNAETITTSTTTPVSSSAGTGLSGPSVWSGPVILSGNVSLGADGAQNLPNGISTGSINFVGQISDMVAGSNPTIDKVGGGDVIFAGANTYGGLTDVQQGNLVVDNSQALGANSTGVADGTTVEVGAALELESNLGAEVSTLNGDGSSFNDHFTGALRNIAGDNTYTGNVIFGPTDPNSTITLGADSGSELTMIGTISGGSAGSVLVKEGTGTIAFDNENPNTYSGSTAVYQGALQAETSTAFSSGSVVVLDGAQVQLQNTQDIQTLAVTATTGTFTLSFTGPNSANAIVTDTTTPLDVTSATLASDIQAALDALANIGGVGGSVTVTQQSPGVFTVAFGGTLFGDNERALAINNLTLAGGTVTGGVVPVNVPNALNLSGTGIFGTGAMLDTGGNNTWSGNITLGLFPGFSPSTLPSGDVSIGANTGDTLTLAGPITDLHEQGQNNNGFQPSLDQESGLNKVGFGTVVLQSPHGIPNDFSGGVTVTQGILVAGDSGALGSHPTIDPTLGTVQQIVTLSNEQVGTFQLSFDGATTTMSYGTTAAKMEQKLTGPTGLFASAGLVGVDISVVETPIETTSESVVTSLVPAGNLYTITFGGTLLDTAIPLSATGAGGTVAGASFVTLGGTDVIVDTGAELDLNNSNTPSNAIDVVGHTINLNGSGLSGNGALQNTAGDNTWDGVVFIQTGPASSGTTNTKPAFNASIGATSGTSLTLAGTLNTAVIDSVPVTLTLGGVGTGGGGTVIFPSGTSFALHTTITGGNVQVDGSLGVVELAGGAISGLGNVGQIVDSGSIGGIVNPGDNGDSTLVGTNLTFPGESNVPNTNVVGTLTSTGVTLSGLDTYDVYFGDPATPSSSDLLQVNGVIALNGATLSGTIDPNVQVGSSITIIQTDYNGGLNANDVVTGTFVDQSLTGSTPTDPGALATTTAFIDNEKFLVDYYIDHVVITRVAETVTISSLTVTVPPGAPSSPVYGEDVKVSLTLTPEAPNVVLTGSTVIFQIIDPQGSNLQFTETVTAVSPGVYGATIDLPESLVEPLIETTNPLLPDYQVSAVYDGKLSNGALLFSPVSDGTVSGQTATEINGPALVSVAPANTTTTLKVSPTVSGSTYAFGTPLTFTATVTSTLPVGDQPPAAGLGLPVLPPEGSVGFYDNQSGTLTLLGFGTLSTTNGVTTATLSTSTLPVGIHSVTAIYEADGIPDNYNTSNSDATPIALQVTQVASTMTLSANPATIDYNGQIAFTATVIPPAGNQGLPTGNVTFQLGNTILGTAPLFTVGGVTSATFTTSPFQITAASGVLQTITASYAGDGNFGASSATTKVTVNPIGTTTPPATNTLTSSLNPSSAGQSVTFTDTIGLTPSEIGGLSPTGTVVFQITNGAQTIMGSGTVSTLFGLTTATFTTTQMSAGTNTVTATYNGDTNYLGGSAAPITQTVTAATTTTTLVATPAPPAKAVASQAVTLSATVTSPGGTAFGTVIFTDTTTNKPLGTVALDSNGVATIQAVLGLPLAAHSITATFVANSSFTGSSGSATVIVAANGVRLSHVTLASSLDPSLLGQTVTFTATVKDAGLGAAQTPTGSVTFKDSTTGQVLGYGVLSTSGGVTKTTLSTSNFQVGSNSIVAVYTGSTVFAVSSSAALAEVVHGVTPSSVTVTSSLNPSSYGQVVKFTATVQDTGSGTLITPTGTVSFVITNTSTGTTYKGTGTLGVGNPVGTATATFATSSLTTPLPADTYTVTATYNGDAHFISGNNGSLTQTVNQVASTTTITGTAHSVFGQAVTFIATVKPAVGTGVPTGTVSFIDMTSGLTLGTVNVTTKLGKTTATFTTRTLVPNSYIVEAVYNGDANVLTSTSLTSTSQTTVSLTVNQNIPTMTLVSLTTSSNTLVTFTTTVRATAPGTGTPTGTVSFFVDGVFDGTVNLVAGKAALTLPAGLPVGRHTIEADYSGDTDFAQASKTIIVNFVVGRGT